jgi:DNA-binding GntR family transcriptional regulator
MPTSQEASATAACAAVDLNGLQKRILDCLGSAGKELTLRQLETAVECPAEELNDAVHTLVQSGLVSRLNTVIPSYATRYPGVRVYGE